VFIKKRFQKHLIITCGSSTTSAVASCAVNISGIHTNDGILSGGVDSRGAYSSGVFSSGVFSSGSALTSCGLLTRSRWSGLER